MLGFELPAELHDVPFRHRNLGPHFSFDFGDSVYEIAVRDVAPHHLLPTDVLPVDEVGATGRDWEVGHFSEPDLTPLGKSSRNSPSL